MGWRVQLSVRVPEPPAGVLEQEHCLPQVQELVQESPRLLGLAQGPEPGPALCWPARNPVALGLVWGVLAMVLGPGLEPALGLQNGGQEPGQRVFAEREQVPGVAEFEGQGPGQAESALEVPGLVGVSRQKWALGQYLVLLSMEAPAQLASSNLPSAYDGQSSLAFLYTCCTLDLDSGYRGAAVRKWGFIRRKDRTERRLINSLPSSWMQTPVWLGWALQPGRPRGGM